MGKRSSIAVYLVHPDGHAVVNMAIAPDGIPESFSHAWIVARKLGILVFCSVPAIVGGGIVYAAFGSFTAIFIYQVLLLVAAGAFVSR